MARMPPQAGNRSSESQHQLPTWAFVVPPAAALACFLVYLSQIHSLPFFRFLVANPLAYDVEAKQLARGIPADQPFFLSALYPAFVALVYRLSGGSQLVLAVVQGGLAAFNVWLVTEISKRLFSSWTALGAGLIMTFYWSFYYFAGEMVPATLFTTYVLAGILLFLDRDEPRVSRVGLAVAGAGIVISLMYATPALSHLGSLLGWEPARGSPAHYWAGLVFFLVLALGAASWLVGSRPRAILAGMPNLVGSGFALGLGALAWSGATVLAAVFALWLVLVRGARRRALVLLAGFLMPLVASTAYNLLMSGDLIPVTSSFGVNLYIGNNAASDGMDPFKLGEGNHTRIEADRLGLSGKQRSDFFAAQAIKFITSRPGRWLKLEGRKILTFLGRTQINNNADIAERRAAWKRLFLPWLHFGIVFPLAVAGMVAARRENRRALILAAGYASFIAIPLVFFACERFRLPAIAILVPLAAYGAEMIIRYAARRAPAALAAVLVPAIVAGLVSNIDFLGLAKYEMPAIVANKAYVARLAGNPEVARTLALKALKLDPSVAGAHFQLGAIAEEENEPVEALTRYLDCLEADPYFVAAYGAAARILERASISRSYLDTYVDDLTSGRESADVKTKLIDFIKARQP